jgi:hypothetical protein
MVCDFNDVGGVLYYCGAAFLQEPLYLSRLVLAIILDHSWSFIRPPSMFLYFFVTFLVMVSPCAGLSLLSSRVLCMWRVGEPALISWLSLLSMLSPTSTSEKQVGDLYARCSMYTD